MYQRDNITGKDILLVIEPFYGYGEKIEKELLKLGAKSVYRKVAAFFPPSLRDSFSLKSIVSHIRFPRARSKWTEKFEEEVADKHFDTLFVVENMSFEKHFLKYISEKNPGIRKILYLWDTFKTQQSENIDFLPLFDAVYTFDRDDAEKYNLRYYPDFYIDEPIVPLSECKYDISFVGTMNFGPTLYRANALQRIADICKNYKLNTFFYLKHDRITWYTEFLPSRRQLKKAIDMLTPYGITGVEPIPLDICNDAQSKAKVLLDLSHKIRQGMTINAITALALGKKLITTNNRIVSEDFYDESLICVIDPDNPVIPKDFLTANYKPANMLHLRLDNWLKHIVNEEL